MTDLLVNLLPTIRLNPLSTALSGLLTTRTSAARPPALGETPTRKRRQSQSRGGANQPISRALKGVGSLVLSLRDGLTDEEREANRRRDERRQILTLRMKNVGGRRRSNGVASMRG